MLAGLERHKRLDCCSCKQRLPWCWTEEAAPWISQELGLLVFHIALQFCIVLVLAVLTDGRWKLAVTYCNTIRCQHMAQCCRQTGDFVHPAECRPAALQTSMWQWTASVFTPSHCTACCNSLFTEVRFTQYNVTSWFSCWTAIADKCITWYFCVMLHYLISMPVSVAYRKTF